MASAQLPPTPTGINGRPVAISPRMINPNTKNNTDLIHRSIDVEGGGLFSSFLCGGSGFGSPRLNRNEVDFDINPTGSYVAVHTKQWQLAVDRLKLYPKEASVWVVRYGNPNDGNNTNTTSIDRNGVVDGGATIMSDGMMTVATPRSGTVMTTTTTKQKTVRWRMLPLHAALLFNGPIEVIKTLIKIYPQACSAHDDQGMLPLHLAFRNGSSEEIVLLLVQTYPEAIQRVDYKGRLPSMLAPKDAKDYGSTIGEVFVRGPTYYYWASRVATADRMQYEKAMTNKIKQLEDDARMHIEQGRNLLDKTEKQLTEEIEALTISNVELKERVVWYETKYDGVEEKEKVLVDHTNSLAERLRLTSLSEEHLATKLAKLETRLQNKETELEQARASATEEKDMLEARAAQLERNLIESEHKVESLVDQLAKKEEQANETNAQFLKERELFEKQIDASKECLMELIASSKEDKRIFEQDTAELRRQLMLVQGEVQKTSLDEKRTHEKDSQELRSQLQAIQTDLQQSKMDPTSPAVKAIEDRLDNLQQEVANNTLSFQKRVEQMEAEEEKQRATVLENQISSATKIENRLDTLQHEIESAKSYMSSTQSIRKAREPEDEDVFETYVSTKKNADTCESGRSEYYEASPEDERDDYECAIDTSYSNESELDKALAIGNLTQEQREALEDLDLSGDRDQIAMKLSLIPGLTKNQISLLVDVASSLVM